MKNKTNLFNSVFSDAAKMIPKNDKLAEHEKDRVSKVPNDFSNLTLKQWVHVFLDDFASAYCKPSSFEHYADNLEKHLLPALGDYLLADITSPVIQSFLNEQSQYGNLKTGGPLSAKSIRNMRTSISSCLSQAVSLGLIPSNPVSGTVIRKAQKPAVEIMEDRDMEKLMDFVFNDGNLMNAGIILAGEFALRRGEICALRWKHFDGVYLTIRETVKRLRSEDDGNLKTHLVFCSPKTESSVRYLAVSPAMNSYLLAQKERFRKMFGEPGPEDFIVFNSAGGVTDPDNLSHYFSDVLAGLDLPHVKFHALRHTFASKAIECGIDINSVSGILGHSSVNTTCYYYLHSRQQGMNEALWKLSGEKTPIPSSLPCIVRGKEIQHRYTRRSSFNNSTNQQTEKSM